MLQKFILFARLLFLRIAFAEDPSDELLLHVVPVLQRYPEALQVAESGREFSEFQRGVRKCQNSLRISEKMQKNVKFP